MKLTFQLHVQPSTAFSRRLQAAKPCRIHCRCQSQPQDHEKSADGKHLSPPTDPSSDASASRRSVLGLLAGSGIALASPKLAVASPSLSTAAPAQKEFSLRLEDKVSEFTLSNGMHFIILERHNAPIVSFHTFANVGAFEEEDGKTGLAHLLEHMAFKGTERVGTKDFKKEAPLLDALDEVFYSLKEAQEQAGEGRGSRATVRLNHQFLDLQREAAELSIPNDFGARLQRAGAVGLNAATSHDATKYYLSLPSNKLELWFALEAERFQAPVFRELYSEKRVIVEERRLRIDNAPLGLYQAAFSEAALANNYRRPIIGYAQDFEGLGRREVQSFFDLHYGPTALTVSIVGDVNPDEARRLAEKYFGGWKGAASVSPPPKGPAKPEPLAMPSGRELYLEGTAAAGPVIMHAYYRPNLASKDAVVLDIISDLLSSSRTSRMHRELILTGKAVSAESVAYFPGDKHACATLLFSVPTEGRTLSAADAELRACPARLAASGVTAKEMLHLKKSAKVLLLDAFRSNSSMAGTLAAYHATTGDWRNVLADLDRIEALTPEEVRAVAERTFAEKNCFTGHVMALAKPAAQPWAGPTLQNV